MAPTRPPDNPLTAVDRLALRITHTLARGLLATRCPTMRRVLRAMMTALRRATWGAAR